MIDIKQIDLIKRLKTVFLDSQNIENQISIFLCGGSTKNEMIFRRRLGKDIKNIHSKYQYSVYYPEDMFIELMFGHQHKDLLKLEDLLANSVHCVIILLRSPGTFTELGAFTNYKELENKLIVVVEPKYKRKSSFINLGPLRYLQTQTKSKIIYSEMNVKHLDSLKKLVSEASRDLVKNVPTKINELTNPIFSRKFYLAMIYVLDPITRYDIIEIIKELSQCNSETSDTILTVAETVLNSLINERKALSHSNKISITPKGVNTLLYDGVLKQKSRDLENFLSSLRLEALNLSLRGEYNRKGGAVQA